MSGSSRRSAVAGLLALAISLTGAALAAPVPVLAVGTTYVPLDEGGRYEYSYRQSIYLAPVTEEHERVADRIAIVRARSSDLRAVEYFRWEGTIAREGNEFVQRAPANGVDRLAIRVTAGGQQRLRGDGWAVSLRDRFGETVVDLRATTVPALLAIAGAP